MFLTFLALGRNFDSFNDLMFHYLPLYNKFRTVEMALVIPGLVFPIVAIWGLREILTEKVEEARLKKGFLWALGLSGGLCVILWLMPSLLLDFRSACLVLEGEEQEDCGDFRKCRGGSPYFD